MATQFKLRRDTAANWTSANPVLGAGEPGYETNTGKLKVGNGTTPWNSLAYVKAGSADTATTATTADSATTATTATTASKASKITASGLDRTVFVSATEPAGMVAGDIWIQA